MNRPAMALLGVMLLVPTTIGTVVAQTETASSVYVWDFDHERPGTLPEQFSIGTLFDGRPAGEWQVVATDRAKSPPHVLAQVMAKGAEHAYKLLLLKRVIAADLDLRVSFLPIQGQADMGGGLVWRAADDRNYYLVRANPLEQNIRVYRVVKGVRHLLQNFDQTIDVRRWHRLQIRHRGCHLQVFYDDVQIFDLCEDTFQTGQIGMWTKSDAVTYFDDLHVQRLQ